MEILRIYSSRSRVICRNSIFNYNIFVGKFILFIWKRLFDDDATKRLNLWSPRAEFKLTTEKRNLCCRVGGKVTTKQHKSWIVNQKRESVAMAAAIFSNIHHDHFFFIDWSFSFSLWESISFWISVLIINSSVCVSLLISILTWEWCSVFEENADYDGFQRQLFGIFSGNLFFVCK